MSSDSDRPTAAPTFGTTRRQPLTVSPDALCNIEPLRPGALLPVVVRPAVPGIGLPSWLQRNRDVLSERLSTHGGVLFRGFGINSSDAFQSCIAAVSGELLEYTYRSTPRRRVSGRIYTSTEYPADRSIPLHNEMSYTRTWPMKIWFSCQMAAAVGGETPLADSRRVFQRISPAVRERFAARGVMYVRNYGGGVDLPWQEVFQTEDPADVERLCREAGIETEWRGHDSLTTRQVCQGTAVHPVTHEDLWFNQAHLFHVSSLGDEAMAVLTARFAEDELPRHARYGDGSPIEPTDLQEIRAAYDAETVAFAWHPGDALLLDNMLIAHGRRPFEGPRSVLTGMAERHGMELAI